jgi:hypothetical protein
MIVIQLYLIEIGDVLMRVFRINNINNSQNQKKRVNFQAAKNPAFIIKKADAIVNGAPLTNTQARTFLKDLLSLIPEDVLKKARFEAGFAKIQANCTRALSNPTLAIEKKKKAIDSVFATKESAIIAKSDKVEKYIFKNIIAHVQNNKDKDLAEHILTHSEINMEETFKNESARKKLHERLMHFTRLGSKKNISELEQLQRKVTKDYSREQMTQIEKVEAFYSDSKEQVDNHIKTMLNGAIKKTIEQLSTNPAF